MRVLLGRRAKGGEVVKEAGKVEHGSVFVRSVLSLFPSSVVLLRFVYLC